MDMLDVLHAKKAQSLISDQDYKLILHKYTTLPDDIKVMAAKKAYELQSEVKAYSILLHYTTFITSIKNVVIFNFLC